MTKPLAAAFLAMFVSAPALALDCMIPVLSRSGLSVAAPEMELLVPVEPTCIRADMALASLRLPIVAPGAYVPLTKDDNSPWRFDMSQNGKRMTSVEFDAWMKAKGIRVATGKPTVQSAPEVAVPPGSAAPSQSNQ